MTNYSKDVSQYQLTLTAANLLHILKRVFGDAKSGADPSETELRIRRHDILATVIAILTSFIMPR
jgi:hypothetical protein